jgi:hypothetical protein
MYVGMMCGNAVLKRTYRGEEEDEKDLTEFDFHRKVRHVRPADMVVTVPAELLAAEMRCPGIYNIHLLGSVIGVCTYVCVYAFAWMTCYVQGVFNREPQYSLPRHP